jgi:predicted RNase H-like nuclease
MKIVGVDGCRGRWLAVAMDLGSGSIAASIHATPDALLLAYPDAAAVALDMPIGLTCAGPRECDIAARRLLGWPRSSSVFPAPIRDALRGQKPLRHGKKSPEGKNQRRRLLERSFDRKKVVAALANLAGERFGMDDFHDAFVALWSACRIVRKKACCLPERPPIDTCGLKMGIWY